MFHARSNAALVCTVAGTLAGLGGVGVAGAATFVEGADPTTVFAAGGLLLDEVVTSPVHPSKTVTGNRIDKKLDVATGRGEQTVTIHGIGLSLLGGTTDGDLTLTVTHMGTAKSGDEVVLGTRTATLDFGAEGQYTVTFDTPLVAVIDLKSNVFRVEVASTGSLQYNKVSKGGTPLLSVGGSVVVGGSAETVPEEPG